MRSHGRRSKALGDALLARPPDVYLVASGARRDAATLDLRSAMTPLRREVERLLDAGSRCGVPKTAGTCQDIWQRCEAWWTCVQVEGAEPTNNTAERAIRPGVLAKRLGVPHCRM